MEKLFIDALCADRPSAELGSNADLYGWLIGSWSIKTFDYHDGKGRIENAGEWHFSWVLEGRAIQDIFIVPVRSRRVPNMSKQNNRYGTTLRIYDPEFKAWRIAWTNPVRTIQSRLIARKVGNDIVQEGKDEDGHLMRWSFVDIKTDSFRWTGEESKDNGETWHLGAEFFATRQSADRKR